MAYHDHGVFKVDQKLLQPGYGVHIQMVGRLVKKEYIGVSEQGLCKQDLYLLRAVKIAHHAVVQLCLYPEAVKEVFGVGLGFPPVHFGKFGLKLARSYTVLVGKILFGIYGILFLHYLIKAFVSEDDGIQDRVVIIFEMILLKDRYTLPGSNGDIAARGIKLSGKDL